MARDNDKTTVGGKEIQAVTDDSVENILGWTVVFTIGPSFVVDRSWLETRAEELGIPNHVLCSETTPKRAFTRAAKRTPNAKEGAGRHPDVEMNSSRSDDDYDTFELELVDRRGDEIYGETIADLCYDKDSKDVYYNVTTDTPEYAETAAEYGERFMDTFDTMKESNIGVDIRKMIRDFCNKHSLSVKMRDAGAVYFVPETHGDVLMAMRELVKDIDQQWKTRGFECAIDPIETIDSAEKRDMVQRKVEKEVDGIVESALDSAFEELEELDEEEVAEEVISDVGQDLVRAENLAAEYNDLLDVEMSIREKLKGWKDEVKGDKEDLVEKAAEQVEV